MSAGHMFDYPRPRGRSPLAALLSLVVHGAAGAGVMWLAAMQVARPPMAREPVPVFVRVTLPASPVEVVEEVEKNVERVERIAALRDVPPLENPRPEPSPEPDAAVKRPEPLDLAAAEPRPAILPVPEPPPARRPAIRVGEFAAATAITPEVDRPQVRPAGFEAQQAVAPAINIAAAAGARATEVGTFASDDANARPGTDRSRDRPTAPVASAGFESARAVSPGTSAREVVSSSGFGSTSASAARPPAAAPAAAGLAGFSEAPPAPAPAARPGAARAAGTPVEVLYKPTPAYSAEARALKIEGEVTLEVQFSASGEARVLRVVRGLGHGLDEMAIRAAEQIRFKPAEAAGQPVEFTANVQIVFRLT